MRKLNYTFECLWGVYNFSCEFDKESVVYEYKSTINEEVERQGELNKEDAIKFNELIDQANIKSWDKQGEDLDIEDKTAWQVVYIDEEKEYVCKGYEGSWPYNYQSLINAMKLCDIDTSVMDIQENN